MDVLCDTEGRRVNVGGGIYGDGYHQLEDDAVYAELVRQVLILTADDDHSTAIPCRNDVGYFDSVSQPAAGTGSLWCGSSNDSVPTWPAANMNMSRNGGGGFGGTGVFIPLTAAKSRRRNGNGRRGSSNHNQQAQKMVLNKH